MTVAVNSNNSRKSRKTISKAILQIIKNINSDEEKTIKEKMSITGLSKACLYKWEQILTDCNGDIDLAFLRIRKPGARTVLNGRKTLNVMSAVQNDPLLTQKGIVEMLKRENVVLSQPSVSLHLKKCGISRKRVTYVSDRVTSSDVKEKRKTFSTFLRLMNNEDLIYLDETGFNLHTRTKFGYSPINTPVKSLRPANKGRNVSLLCLINCNNILNFSIIEGAFSSKTFLEFIDDCNEKGFFKNKTLIMDNVAFHKSINILDFFQEKNIKHMFLPPYSPSLNPIEEVFSCIKSRYFNIRPFARSSNDIKNYISEIIMVMNSENSNIFNNFYNNMRRYLDLAFRGIFF